MTQPPSRMRGSDGAAGAEATLACAGAPMFARSHAISWERLQPARARPRREATRTLAEARKLGLSMPEALDLTPEEMDSEG